MDGAVIALSWSNRQVRQRLQWLRGLRCFVVGKRFDDGDRCPWCGSYHYNESLDVEYERSGSASTEDGLQRWAEGTATCWECGHRFPYCSVNP